MSVMIGREVLSLFCGIFKSFVLMAIFFSFVWGFFVGFPVFWQGINKSSFDFAISDERIEMILFQIGLRPSTYVYKHPIKTLTWFLIDTPRGNFVPV